MSSREDVNESVDTLDSPIIQDRDDHLLSAAESAQATVAPSVSLERKEALLQQARDDRLAWINNVMPLPFDNANSSSTAATVTPLSKFKSSHVAQLVPSALPLLSHLYGSTTTNLEECFAKALPTDDDALAIPTARQQLQAALDDTTTNHDRSLLQAYQLLLERLSDPASAVLVQTLRNWCRNFVYEIKNNKKENKDISEKMLEKLRACINNTIETLKTHVLWKKDLQKTDIGSTTNYTRRALESFIYGHCHEHIERVLWKDDFDTAREQTWQERLNLLQFVTPANLEVDCLQSHDVAVCRELLQPAISALNSINLYYSPMEKLERIRTVYHSINAGLKAALDQSNGPKLASADDVLPTMIWSVLQAKPVKLQWNLQFIEDYAPSELMRGEAGYAYTNLYGAVHFLLELNLDEPTSLSIDPQVYKQSIESARLTVANVESKQKTKLSKSPVVTELTTHQFTLTASKVRKARQNGENVDLAWALKQQNDLATSVEKDQTSMDKSKAPPSSQVNTDKLLSGFTRSYNFLSSRPEDIKLSDLPTLLSEYNMLVRTTEALISERSSTNVANRKISTLAQQQELYLRAAKVDPSILPKKVKKQVTMASVK